LFVLISGGGGTSSWVLIVVPCVNLSGSWKRMV
jgi:hypothetical protein